MIPSLRGSSGLIWLLCIVFHLTWAIVYLEIVIPPYFGQEAKRCRCHHKHPDCGPPAHRQLLEVSQTERCEINSFRCLFCMTSDFILFSLYRFEAFLSAKASKYVIGASPSCVGNGIELSCFAETAVIMKYAMSHFHAGLHIQLGHT